MVYYTISIKYFVININLLSKTNYDLRNAVSHPSEKKCRKGIYVIM